MDLWIRSQNKEMLLQVNMLFIGEDGLTIYDGRTNILGKYKSKERALEVLDEMQKLLKPKILLKCNMTPGIVDGKLENISVDENIDFEPIPRVNIYEMPKE